MIAAILGGETQVFHDLIRPHERSVYLMALSYMKNEADAEDVAQEAFVRAFRNLASFRAESKFSTWLISITLNEARTRLRRKMLVPHGFTRYTSGRRSACFSGFAARLARDTL